MKKWRFGWPEGRTYAYYLSDEALDCIIEMMEGEIESRPQLIESRPQFYGTLQRFIDEREHRLNEER